jgi:hypothetical protein
MSKPPPRSISAEAFRLCKDVLHSKSLPPARTLLNSLLFTATGDQGGPNDRSFFGYMARRQECQLLGFLLVDQSRSDLATRNVPALPDLSPKERVLIRRAQASIERLNRSCASALTSLGVPFEVVNPYSRRQYDVLKERPLALFSSTALNRIALAFESHSAVRCLRELEPPVQMVYEKKFGPGWANELAGQVAAITTQIYQAGAMRAPDELGRTILGLSTQSEIGRITAFICSLLSIRASIATVDQLVYQALLGDKLISIDKSNLVAIRQLTSHMAGTGLSISVQAGERTIALEPPTIVFLDVTAEHLTLNTPAQVEQFNFSSDRDWGDLIGLEVRTLNEDMHPFSPLVSNFIGKR